MLGYWVASWQRRARVSEPAFGRCRALTMRVVERLFSNIVCQLVPVVIAGLVFICTTVASVPAFAVPPGTVISNTAQLDYTVGGSPRTQFSNPVSTTTGALRTDAEITVARYWPANTLAVATTVPATFYEDASGTLQAVGDVFTPGSATPLDLSSPLLLADAGSLIGSEPLFVRVADADQNLDSTVADTVRVVLTSASGDTEVLILTETGPDTGVFVGVVQTTTGASGPSDGVLAVAGNDTVTAIYTDPIDGSDSVDGSVLVDPFGLVFESCSGAPVDGAQVTLINADTNSPAAVFGNDGVSSYPSTVVSGGGATDGSGLVYDFPAGSYRFPLLAPGNYQLQIVPPDAYGFPSLVPDATLQALPGAPFVLNGGSRGNVFVIVPGPAVQIDVPVDCSGDGLLVTKTSGRTVVGIGDFLPYEVSVSNGGNADIIAVVVNDVLPPGFRYAKGSARVGDSVIADPEVAAAGSALSFAIGSLAIGDSATLSYVVEVTAGARTGDAINSASATDGLGATSNVATVRVRVRDDFFRDKTFISGRIFDESGAEQSCAAAEDEAAGGLENARVYLEDGTVILSDETGRFHFEGLTPGTHVVQLDSESLPDNYEIVQCDDDTRSAGRAFSRFVDIQGGGLWRVDFYVRERAPEPDQIKQNLGATSTANGWRLSVELSGNVLPVNNIRPMIILPAELNLVPDSVFLDGMPADVPEARGNVLIFNVGSGEGNWNKLLELEVSGVSPASVKAMTALTSGGKVHRIAPVELQLTNGEVSALGELALLPPEVTADANEDLEQVKPSQRFTGSWLATAKPGLQWLYPGEREIPSIGSTALVAQHAPGQKVTMLLNDAAVSPLNYYGAEVNKDSGVAVSRWQGVDIKTGDNRFVAVVSDAAGVELQRMERIVHFSDTPAKAVFVADQSSLIADGREAPVVAVQFFDRHGYPARPGAIGTFEINAPYESKERFDRLKRQSLAVEQAEQAKFEIGQNGVALIALQPTTRVGEAVLSFTLEDDYREEIRARLQVGKREWIVVGLAEGVVREYMTSGNERGLRNHGIEDGSDSDGRIAFFAKGMIRGDWLVTASYDTDKKTGDALKQVIDPDSYYTLYGDNAYQQYEAASQRKLFLKLEKQRFYAMLGDFDTGLNETELGAYSRSVNGIKTEYFGDRVGFNVFVTESEQGFVRQEIRGDGTSGSYFLGSADIAQNSEKIVIETRDRLHSEQIVETRSLSRHIDYNIDYDAGTVYFRSPVASRGDDFNPIFIVAEYEVGGGVNNSYTGGGRVTLKASDNIEVGATAIRENNSAKSGDLIAGDMTWQLGDNTELRVEAARSEQSDSQTGEKRDGTAYIAELEHRGQNLKSLTYVRQQEAEFGLGQQRGTEAGTRKIGNQMSLRVGENIELQADVYRQKTLDGKDTRDVVDTRVEYDREGKASAYTGLRHARDRLGEGEDKRSDQVLMGGYYKVFDNKITLRSDLEWGLGQSNDNDSPDFPNRLLLGADYKLTESYDLFFENEWSWGEDRDNQNSRAGLRARPWTGFEASSALEQQATTDGARMFATLGASQIWRINDYWTLDFSADRSQNMEEPEFRAFDEDVPVATGEREDFTSLSTSLGYRKDNNEWLGKVEWRDSDTQEKRNVNLGWLRELDDGFTFAAGVDLRQSSNADNGWDVDGDGRIHLAYRPSGSPWTILERLDFIYEDTNLVAGGQVSRRLVSNLLVNYRATDYQWNLHWGIKQNLDTIAGKRYDSLTDTLLGEYRRDLGSRWDVGMQAGFYHSWNANVMDFNYGLSLGHSPAKNIWISAGYNFTGFRDEDFSSADYTAKGMYIKFRMKFDQFTLQDLWKD
ncbi:MAG: hypothetical protein V7721_01665 [Porticoccaceae bacterium]